MSLPEIMLQILFIPDLFRFTGAFAKILNGFPLKKYYRRGSVVQYSRNINKKFHEISLIFTRVNGRTQI